MNKELLNQMIADSEWQQGDGIVPGHFAAKPLGHKMLHSAVWTLGGHRNHVGPLDLVDLGDEATVRLVLRDLYLVGTPGVTDPDRWATNYKPPASFVRNVLFTYQQKAPVYPWPYGTLRYTGIRLARRPGWGDAMPPQEGFTHGKITWRLVAPDADPVINP